LEADVLAALAETGLQPGIYALGMGNATLEQDARWADW
tara:strand:- start:461 stop:574 length:114 start_codon:yes stop_codon:yes gene_type:complete